MTHLKRKKKNAFQFGDKEERKNVGKYRYIKVVKGFVNNS